MSEDNFERMLREDCGFRLWGLWQHAFLSAMNTEGSWKAFMRQIRDGTALDWWKTRFVEGVESGEIVPRTHGEATRQAVRDASRPPEQERE